MPKSKIKLPHLPKQIEGDLKDLGASAKKLYQDIVQEIKPRYAKKQTSKAKKSDKSGQSDPAEDICDVDDYDCD